MYSGGSDYIILLNGSFGYFSDWWLMKGGVPQGSALGRPFVISNLC